MSPHNFTLTGCRLPSAALCLLPSAFCLLLSACYNRAAKRHAKPMRVSRRIILPVAALFLAATLVLSSAEGRGQGTASRTPTNNWTGPVGELVGKILSRGAMQGGVALTVRNMSSLSDEDVSQIRRELRLQLRSHGIRLSAPKQASIGIQVSLSENVEGFVWIAEIQDGDSHDVAMIAVARSQPQAVRPNREALTIRQVSVYEQAQPLLDFALLDNAPDAVAGQGVPAARGLALSLDSVALWERAPKIPDDREEIAAWRLKQSAPLTRAGPWPRDARGRLIIGRDNSYSAYLPGMKCSGATAPALSLACQEGDEPWPLGGTGIGPVDTAGTTSTATAGPASAAAYFAPNRNFFDGRIRFGDGREVQVAPFFSATSLPIKTGAVWLLARVDGRAQLLTANADPVASLEGLGSDIVSFSTGCQSGWQVLATSAGNSEESDAIQAYEIVNRKAVAVGTPAEFAGPVTALWPLADGSGAMAIVHNLKSASYEAIRLSITCGQ